MWFLIMRIKKKKEDKVLVVIKDGNSTRSKTITIYDCTIDQMIKEIKNIVESNAT